MGQQLPPHQMDKMPKWLRRAVKDGVMSYQEAQHWHLLTEMCSPHLDEIFLPRSLHQAAERLHLMELQQQGGRQ